jgi:hypothetical protein
MKVAKEDVFPVLNQLRNSVTKWRQGNAGIKNIAIPPHLRDKIRGLSGLYSLQKISTTLGIDRGTIAKIMRECVEKGTERKPLQQTLPQVITLAPLQVNAPNFSGNTIAELESPQGWKLKVSGQFDLSAVIKAMMEVRV